MDILLKKGDVRTAEADLVIVGQFEESDKLAGAVGALNVSLDDLVASGAVQDGFTGKLGQSFHLRRVSGIKAPHVLVVGLGKQAEANEEMVRTAAAVAMNEAARMKAVRVVSSLFGVGGGKLPAKEAMKAAVEGVLLAAYSYSEHKSESAESSVTRFTFVSTNATVVRQAEAGRVLGLAYAQATNVARALVNAPASHQSPMQLAQAAKVALKGSGVTVKVYERAALETLGMGGLLGVAQGSEHPPVLVHLTYKPKTATKKRIALVGKAVTFDSGGLSLKPAGSMETMKMDMAGSAAVIGAFSALKDVQPNVEVHGFFGACENMPSGKALRPGDVVKIMNGKTIEIRNTDAEGRVTLADVLQFALRSKPDAIVDLATLTGACVVALGEEITGLMSNDRQLAQRVLDASVRAGEKMWELPLEERYRELIKSDIADYKNDAPRWGGALTAGLLLEEFVNKTPWVHLDIAGPAFAERPVNAYTKKGGTGHAVRTLLELVRSYR